MDGPIAARAAHAMEMRARLDALWAQLVTIDAHIGEGRALWRTHLSDADRAAVRSTHSQLVERAEELFAQADHLAALLGIPADAWPELPQLQALAQGPDELGWDDHPPVWFTEWFDLVTGPLWMRPTWRLRARAAAIFTLVALLCSVMWRQGWATLGTARGGAAATITDTLVAADPGMVVLAAALLGAVFWPLLLATGFLRRVLRRIDATAPRWAVGAAALTVPAAAACWQAPAVAAAWIAAAAALGAAAGFARPTVARMWVRWWTATVGVRVEEWRRTRRSRRGPQRGSRRLRRRVRVEA